MLSLKKKKKKERVHYCPACLSAGKMYEVGVAAHTQEMEGHGLVHWDDLREMVYGRK